MMLRLTMMGVAALAIVACGDDDGPGGGPAGGSGATGGAGGGPGGGGVGGESAPPERAAGMTDLSILFPLPDSEAELDGLLAAGNEGAHGELLPFDVYDQAPQLSFSFSDKPSEWAALRVVGARLDPCFPGLGADECRHQIRLVLQPIELPPSLLAADAAVHVFYELDEAEFTGLLGDVTRAQSAEDAEGPLVVHPAMAREGLLGEAGEAIRAAILKRVGEARLSRMTFMQLGGQGNVWTFGGFDVEAGSPTPIAIVGSDEETQQFQNNALPDPQDFHGLVDPVLMPDDFSVFYESDIAGAMTDVGSSRVDLQACKLEYSIVSPK